MNSGAHGIISLMFCILFTVLTLTTGAHGQPCALSDTRVELDWSGEPDGFFAERKAYIEQESSRLFGSPDASASCVFSIELRLQAGPPDMNDTARQDFHIQKEGSNALTATARSSLGLVYAFMEVLDQIGFRYPQPGAEIKPQWISLSDFPDDIALSPLIALRGFWLFGDGLDPEFLEWAGRNRFNLAGGRFEDQKGLRKIFGIRRWSGGHDVISTLVPTDREVDGQMLLQEHPSWFAESENPIPFGRDSYRNPCLGDPDFINFFSRRLAAAIIDETYGENDIINLWPSDSPSLSIPKSCRRAEGSEDDKDDLIAFYRGVTQALASDPELALRAVRPTIAGIGYYDTFDLASTNKRLPSTKEDYVHIFYTNVRSYRSNLFEDNSNYNPEASKSMDDTIKSHENLSIGIVDYHNYSIYNAMFPFSYTNISKEFGEYYKRGAHLYAWMHPSARPTVMEMMLNRVISRLLFGNEAVDQILSDFNSTILNDDTHVSEALSLYGEAITNNISELFGPDQSLRLVLGAEYHWSSPSLTLSEVAAIARVFIEGGRVAIPTYRLGYRPPVKFEMEPLEELIGKLERAGRLVENSDSTIGQKLASDAARATLMYQQLLHYAKAIISADDGDASRCLSHAAMLAQGADEVRDIEWPEYVIDYDMRERIAWADSAVAEFLRDDICQR